MEKNRKAVSVLIAVYEPNLKWFGQLLRSIRSQSFQDFEVLIMDDGSVHVSYEDIKKNVSRVFGSSSYVTVFRSSRNEGSNKTFEKLARLAGGEYVAFCDQDDIWEKEKLQMLVAEIRHRKAVIAYSDMSVIDQNGHMLYSSLRSLRIHMEFVSGRNLSAKYVMDNCTASCSMLVRTEAVRKAMPFFDGTYCDQWICAVAAADGAITFVDLPLVRYRRHDRNQTGTLSSIHSRQDYYDRRVLPACGLVKEMKKRGIHYKYEADIQAFAKARKKKDISGIWKYRRFNRKYAYFDILILCLPDWAAGMLFRIFAYRRKGRALR